MFWGHPYSFIVIYVCFKGELLQDFIPNVLLVLEQYYKEKTPYSIRTHKNIKKGLQRAFT